MKKRSIDTKKLKKELNKAFDAKRMASNLASADLENCKSELKFYSKQKAKDSTVDSSTLAMRYR